MDKRRTDKVVCYVVHDGRILTFTQLGVPLTQTGVQVPAGTIKPGESPEEAALREATEETGLADLRAVRVLGEAEYDISPYRHEIMHRTFVELTVDSDPAAAWMAGEPDPEGGGTAIRWECRWIPLAQAHVLAAGLGALIGLLDE